MNQTAFSVLRLLNDGEFHSGVSISKQLQCSRATISNALKRIECIGVDIAKIHGRGYCWCNPIIWLNSESILRCTSSQITFIDLKLFDSIDSTNNYLLNDFQKQPNDNDFIPIVAAELQTNGRGRLGRTWHTGLGDSLTFSLRWRFEQGVSALSGLSLVIGIGIVRVLKSLSINNVNLKWPNDILFDYHKLAGVLIELSGEILGPSYAVIGIGINFSLSQIVKSSIDQKITDLLFITGKYLDRNLVLGALLSELRSILISFGKYGFVHFKKEWLSYHVYEGQPICLTLPNNSVIEGTVDGVNDDGSICMITNKGKNSYNVGDISMRLK
jgi:BirA family biotin operon repressor/biotin-[acetyl-CoA-carboxylase] ligase